MKICDGTWSLFIVAVIRRHSEGHNHCFLLKFIKSFGEVYIKNDQPCDFILDLMNIKDAPKLFGLPKSTDKNYPAAVEVAREFSAFAQSYIQENKLKNHLLKNMETILSRISEQPNEFQQLILAVLQEKDNIQQKGASYLSDVCRALESGDAQLVKAHNHLLLTLKCGSEQYEFNLFELPAAERRKEIEYLLFRLSAQLLSAQRQIKGLEDQLQEVIRTTSSAAHGGFLEPKSKPASKAKKPTGHSLVNPNSKKRKTATGVVFGEDN